MTVTKIMTLTKKKIQNQSFSVRQKVLANLDFGFSIGLKPK